MDYEAEQRRLRSMIAELDGVKTAQRDGSAHQLRYQQRIDDLTDRLALWETNAAALAGADQEIAMWRRRVRLCADAATTAGHGWLIAAGGAGGLGAVLVLTSILATTPLWVSIMGWLLFTAATALLLLAFRAKRERLLDLRHSRGRLADAHAARDALMPS